MADTQPDDIEFPCPTCGAIITVDGSDRDVVRQIGSEKGIPFVIPPLLIQVQCRECGRLIIQTVIRDR